MHYDEDGAVNDFIQKDLKGTIHEKKDEDKKDNDQFDDDDDDPRGKKKKSGDDSEKESNEGSAEEADDDENNGGQDNVRQRPKLTKAVIDRLKDMQERDMFEDILEVKN